MTDRVPLEQVIDKEPEVEQLVDKREQTTTDKTIDEMKDLNMLSMMLGFDKGFDGAGQTAESIYAWAKSMTGELGGPRVLQHIKNTLRLMGATDKGKPMLRKLAMYTTLDTRQKDLQTQKENLYG